MRKKLIAIAGFSGAISIALGAFGAHGLKQKVAEGLITQRSFDAFNTASEYQMYHALALLLVVLLGQHYKSTLFVKAGYAFVVGTLLFSGSLYLLSTAPLIGLSNPSWLGPITPIGGLFFMIGWVLVLVAALRSKDN